MFSKQHYEALADLIADVRLRQRTKARREAIDAVVQNLLLYFISDNPAFDNVRFKKMCGLPIDGTEIVTDTSQSAKPEQEPMEEDFYDGPGLESAPLGNGFEVYLARDFAGIPCLRSRPISLQRDSDHPYDYWLCSVSRNGLNLFSHIARECGVRTDNGVVHLIR